jgi:hypothetical protein
MQTYSAPCCATLRARAQLWSPFCRSVACISVPIEGPAGPTERGPKTRPDRMLLSECRPCTRGTSRQRPLRCTRQCDHKTTMVHHIDRARSLAKSVPSRLILACHGWLVYPWVIGNEQELQELGIARAGFRGASMHSPSYPLALGLLYCWHPTRCSVRLSVPGLLRHFRMLMPMWFADARTPEVLLDNGIIRSTEYTYTFLFSNRLLRSASILGF